MFLETVAKYFHSPVRLEMRVLHIHLIFYFALGQWRPHGCRRRVHALLFVVLGHCIGGMSRWLEIVVGTFGLSVWSPDQVQQLVVSGVQFDERAWCFCGSRHQQAQNLTEHCTHCMRKCSVKVIQIFSTKTATGRPTHPPPPTRHAKLARRTCETLSVDEMARDADRISCTASPQTRQMKTKNG